MDTFVTHWQEFVSLMIVGAAVVLIIRSKHAAFKTNHVCSTCALVQERKHPRTR